jgi:hypothetical protein
MVFAFDTLSFARFLRDRRVSQEHAEAHAEAARQFIMAELVTKTDLQAVAAQLGARLDNLSTHFDTKLDHFDTKLDNLSLRLTVRLGIMLGAGVGVLAALVKLT